MNEILLAVIIAFLVAQSSKVLIVFFRKRKFVPALFLETGGMPSSHSAVASALTLSIFLSEGFSSLFVLSTVFAIVTMRDAMGVRHSVGQHAKVLNVFVEAPLKVLEGHTPLQVIVGCALGVIIGFIVYYL